MTEQNHIVVIGAANADITGISTNPLKLNESNPGKINMGAGGVGRNIADNFARLAQNDQITTYLLSAIGDDLYGKMVSEQSRQAGIDLSHCKICPDAATATYFSIVGHTGEMSSAINDMQIVEQIDVDYLTSKAALINQAKLIVLDANLDQTAIDYICQNFHHIPIFADTVSAAKAAKFSAHIKSIFCLKPNINEAEILAGSMVNGQDDFEHIAAFFHQQGLQRLYITLGAKGIYSSVQDNAGICAEFVAAFTGEISNVNGAGDAFMAGLLYAFINKKTQSEQIQFAQACAFFTAQSEFTINKNLNFEAVTKLMESQNDQ
uniref:Pseudouridine kinase n=1 Tax=OCS116 cluster bacterium TaxID=2030921 RepID=A0A2A4YUQ4_9PROT